MLGKNATVVNNKVFKVLSAVWIALANKDNNTLDLVCNVVQLFLKLPTLWTIGRRLWLWVHFLCLKIWPGLLLKILIFTTIKHEKMYLIFLLNLNYNIDFGQIKNGLECGYRNMYDVLHRILICCKNTYSTWL